MIINNTEERYAIYGMLFSLSNRIQAMGDKEFKDITMKQHFLMIGLDLFEKPPTLKEMGDLIGCTYQNVKRMAQHLETEGYLKLVQDKDDRRKLLLVPTRKMKEFTEDSKQAAVNFMDNLYREIPMTDLEVTLNTLKKMNRNVGGIIE